MELGLGLRSRTGHQPRPRSIAMAIVLGLRHCRRLHPCSHACGCGRAVGRWLGRGPWLQPTPCPACCRNHFSGAPCCLRQRCQPSTIACPTACPTGHWTAMGLRLMRCCQPATHDACEQASSPHKARVSYSAPGPSQRSLEPVHARVCVCVALVWHGAGLFLDELTTDLHNSVRRT